MPLPRPDKVARRLRQEIKTICHKQVDSMLKSEVKILQDGSAATLLDVLEAHVRLGYGINVSLSVRHPDEEGQVQEDPEAAAMPKPGPLIIGA